MAYLAAKKIYKKYKDGAPVAPGDEPKDAATSPFEKMLSQKQDNSTYGKIVKRK